MIFTCKTANFSLFSNTVPHMWESCYPTLRWATKLLFGRLLVVLHTCKHQIISSCGGRTFWNATLKVSTKSDRNSHQNRIGNKWFFWFFRKPQMCEGCYPTLRWATKLLFGRLLVVLHRCKHQSISSWGGPAFWNATLVVSTKSDRKSHQNRIGRFFLIFFYKLAPLLRRPSKL